MKATIYVELLGEGVDCWRPVEAEHLGANRYRITGEPPDGESWAFGTGSVVRCDSRGVAWGLDGDASDVPRV